ncbi:MAG: hypothetical protein HYV07_34290 [Deltaproteobacteria bacterium]|nr:hypothetical protein [Deltaproteobacteria bacterium]
MSSSEAKLSALSEALGLGRDPAPILEALEELYRATDAELETSTSSLALPCREGCDACCHEAVFVSAPEVLFALRELLERDPAHVQRVVAEMIEIAERYSDELELLESIEGEERDEVAERVRFRCPLLVGSSCGIYVARELNARTFGRSVDERSGDAFGCGLTREALVQIGVGPLERKRLPGARDARRRLALAVPKTELVHVYPWWFRRVARFIVP